MNKPRAKRAGKRGEPRSNAKPKHGFIRVAHQESIDDEAKSALRLALLKIKDDEQLINTITKATSNYKAEKKLQGPNYAEIRAALKEIRDRSLALSVSLGTIDTDSRGILLESIILSGGTGDELETTKANLQNLALSSARALSDFEGDRTNKTTYRDKDSSTPALAGEIKAILTNCGVGCKIAYGSEWHSVVYAALKAVNENAKPSQAMRAIRTYEEARKNGKESCRSSQCISLCNLH